MIKQYLEYMTLSPLPEEIIVRYSRSRSGPEIPAKKGSNVLDRNFLFKFLSAEEMQKIRQIIFNGQISNQAFSGYHKDISRDRDGSVIGWVEDTVLHIEADGKVIAPQDCGFLFNHMNHVETIMFNDAFDTGQVISMDCMFEECESLTVLDLSGFDTGQVTGMASMFEGCKNLTKLDLSGFNTAEVTDMNFMFAGCVKLTELDLSSFDTSEVTDISSMFSGCKSLEKLDLSSFNIEKVINMENIFFDCYSLTEDQLQAVKNVFSREKAD